MISFSKLSKFKRSILLVGCYLFTSLLSAQTGYPVPSIKIISPTVDYRSTNSNVSLVKAEISSSESISSFQILNNGKVATDHTITQLKKQDDVTSIIESLITLQKGTNTIIVEVRNNKGKSSSEQFVINCQLEPFIFWMQPEKENLSVLSNKYVIRATIKSDNEIKNVSVNLNGQDNPVQNIVPQKDAVNYTFEKEILLDREKNTIYITASNQRGTGKSTVRSIMIAGITPLIKVFSPAPEDTISVSGQLLVKAEITSKFPIQTFRITDNNDIASDQTMTRAKQVDSITYIVESIVVLKSGMNKILVEASNYKGNSRSETYFVNNHPQPFILWVSPADLNTEVNNGTTSIKAEIKSAYEITEASLNINGSSTSCLNDLKKAENNTFTLEKNIIFDREKNSIEITASNKSGPNKSSIRFIKVGGVTPEISLISPAFTDTITNSGVITVKAKIISKSPIVSFRIYDNEKIVSDEKMTKLRQADSVTYFIESFANLRLGSNKIYAEVTNSKGTSKSGAQFIVMQPQPFIVWLSPAIDYSTTNDGTVPVKAEIKSEQELTNVSINLNGTSITANDGIKKINDNTYSLEKLITIDKDRNSIAIMAANAFGDTRSIPKIVKSTGMAPAITFLAPTRSDSLTNTGVILVRAQISSKIPVLSFRIVNNSDVAANEMMTKPVQKDNETYLIESLVVLKSGMNSIYVEARNSNGTSVSDKHNLSYILEPIVKWILPSTLNSATGSNVLNIRAEISTGFDLLKTSIAVNDSVFTIDNSNITRLDNNVYNIEKKISLSPGNNNIVVRATNPRGTASSPPCNVTYNPEFISGINWINPSESNLDVNSNDLKISALIRSNSKIQSVSLYINDSVAVVSNSASLEPGKLNEFSYKQQLKLKPGSNAVHLAAKTEKGTISSEKVFVNYTVPLLPVLTWRSPTAQESNVTNFILELGMEIGTNTDLEKLSLFHNGKEVTGKININNLKKTDGKLLLEDTLKLVPGNNSIYLTADNKAGRVQSQTRSVILTYSAAPLLSWISPSKPSIDINQNSVRIKIKLKSDEKLKSILTYVNGQASEDLNLLPSSQMQGEIMFEKPISLLPGQNEIYLVATNNSGTTKSDIRYLTNPPTNPPVITWNNPKEEKVIVNSELVLIEACIKSATILKSAQIYVNGNPQASELMFQQPGSGDCNYTFTKQIILKNGDNSIFLIAENFAGSANSERRVIKYELSAITEKRLALIFGNSDYGSSNTLKNPVNDANLMEGTLKQLGFEVIKRINASKNEMESALREFSNKLPQYNVALFYYAGHGVQVEGENFLVPVDATLANKSDCQWEALPVDRIVKQFEQVPDNINIIILDACRNNPFRSWTRGGSEGFKALGAVRGSFVAFATSEGATASDGTGMNGIYTEELVRQMTQTQTIESVFKKTRKEVMDKTGGKQIPMEWSYLTGDFYFKK